jgi:hypothetical protein
MPLTGWRGPEDLIMGEDARGVDRAGRRAKRFLTPLQKYEIWL